MILQAYDFLELNRRYGCRLQMGGSDQWGNIVNGIDLGRRMDEAAAVRPDHAADHHRLRRQDGQDRGGRGLAQRRPRSPYDYWQFWRNTEDADVGRFLRLFTDLPLDEIARLERCRAPRSTRPRRSSPPKPPPLHGRVIQGGGLRVNDVAITDVKTNAGLADLTEEGVIKLSVGRKKHVLVKPV
jgi:tyrosyl-tRNA synthetase